MRGETTPAEEEGAGANQEEQPGAPPSGHQGNVYLGREHSRGPPVKPGNERLSAWRRGPVLTHHCQLWQKSPLLREPQLLHPSNGADDNNTTPGTTASLQSTPPCTQPCFSRSREAGACRGPQRTGGQAGVRSWGLRLLVQCSFHSWVLFNVTLESPGLFIPPCGSGRFQMF